VTVHRRWLNNFSWLGTPPFDAYQSRIPRHGTVRSDARIDPHIAEKLRAVGYLQ